MDQGRLQVCKRIRKNERVLGRKAALSPPLSVSVSRWVLSDATTKPITHNHRSLLTVTCAMN